MITSGDTTCFISFCRCPPTDIALWVLAVLLQRGEARGPLGGALYCTFIRNHRHFLPQPPRSYTASPPKPKWLHPTTSHFLMLLLMLACSGLRVLG